MFSSHFSLKSDSNWPLLQLLSNMPKFCYHNKQEKNAIALKTIFLRLRSDYSVLLAGFLVFNILFISILDGSLAEIYHQHTAAGYAKWPEFLANHKHIRILSSSEK